MPTYLPNDAYSRLRSDSLLQQASDEASQAFGAVIKPYSQDALDGVQQEAASQAQQLISGYSQPPQNDLTYDQPASPPDAAPSPASGGSGSPAPAASTQAPTQTSPYNASGQYGPDAQSSAPVPATAPGTSFTTSTAALSGGGRDLGMTDRARWLMGVGADAASWLGDQGQKAAQAILVTEGGMNNARGDNGQSAGPFQFYEKGQLANFARQAGMSLGTAKDYVEQHPDAAIRWAIGTAEAPGYLGAAIANGVRQGLGGPDLATFAQRTGQVSVSPERAGANYAALFGGGGGPISGGAAQAAMSAENRAGQSFGGSPQDGAGLPPPAPSVPRTPSETATATPPSSQDLLDQVGRFWNEQASKVISQAGQTAVDSATKTLTGSTPEELGQAAQDVGGAAMNAVGSLPTPPIYDPNGQIARTVAGSGPSNLPEYGNEVGRGVAQSVVPEPVRQASVTVPIPEGQIGPVKTGPFTVTGEDVASQVFNPMWVPGIGVGDLAASGATKLAADVAGPAIRAGLSKAGDLLPRAADALMQPVPAQARIGAVTGTDLLGDAAKGWRAADQPDPILKALGPAPEKAAAPPTYGSSLGEQVTRQFFSSDQPLRSFQDDVARITGQPLSRAEMPSEIARQTTDNAAKGMVDQGIKPIVQANRDDLEAVQALLKARNNVNVADVLAKRVAAEDQAANPLLQPARFAAEKPQAPLPTSLDPNADIQQQAQSALRSARSLYESAVKVHPNNPEHPDIRQARAALQDVVDQVNALRENGPLPAPKPGEAPFPTPPERLNAPTPKDYASAVQSLKQQAAIRTARPFSGDVTAEQSKQAIDTLAQQLGPERFARVNDAADQLFAYTGQLRQHLVDSGVWSQQFADQLAKDYPDWVPTRILDYMDAPEAAGGLRVGQKIGLSDSGLRRYTEEGTARFRQDPIQSVIDLTGETLRRSRQNETFLAFKALNDKMPPERQVMRPVSESAKLPPDEMAVNGFVDGAKVRYAVPKAIGNVITGAGSANVPEWSTVVARAFREATTGRNPVFLAGNAALDVPDYTMYMASRLGPQHLPEIVGELAKNYVSTWAGLLQGELRGTSARMMEAGVGQSGAAMRSRATRETVDALARHHVFEIRGTADLARLAKGAAKFEWAAALGERVELAPRRAAFRLMEKHGADPVTAAMTARDATIDFARGGEATKFVNNFVPYFNVPFQALAQPARMFRNNPRAFALTMTSLIGMPTVAAEAWNLADPQRAADYADVNDYYKKNGVVVMLNGGQTDPRTGERQPNFLWVNLRQFAPFATLAREGAHKVLTGQSSGWAELLDSLTNPLLPVDVTNPANTLTRAAGSIPGLGTAAQLALNKNTLTNTDIATRRGDEQAGGTARAVSGLANAGLSALNSTARLRPSQVQFAAPSVAGGLGGVALGAGDLAFGGRPTGSIRETPVVGGVAGRFYRTGGGQLLRDAQAQTVAPDVLKGLEQAGVQYRPGAVPSELKGLPLTQPEQAQFQARANQLANDALRQALPAIVALPAERRDGAAQTVGDRARAQAEQELYAALPPSAAVRPRAGAPAPTGGIEPGRVAGEPPKYPGVTGYARQLQIDEAVSAYDAWAADPYRAPRPTGEQMQLAGRYRGGVNPAWTRWNQQNRETRDATRSAVMTAPLPTR